MADHRVQDLTIDDLTILLDAVEAWESKGAAGEMIGDLLTAMLVKESDPAYEEIQRKQAAMKLTEADEKRARKERSVLLRAKLIQILDQLRADHLISEVQR